MRTKITSRYLVVDSSTIIENGGVIICDGVIEEVGPAHELKTIKADKVIHLKNHILHPGFINAHCHLELSFLKGKLKAKSGLTAWVRALVQKRNQAPIKEVDEGIKRGIARLLATGTTCVGDITATGRPVKALISSGMRAVMFHETLGYQPEVANDRLNELKARVTNSPASPLVSNGVSPHAIYSTSPKLMGKSIRYARRNKMPISIHLCETLEETRFARFGEGPIKKMLEDFGVFARGRFPMVTPVNAVDKAGGLKSLLVAHLNHPARYDLAKLKKRGAKIVISPGCGKWFGRGISAPVLDILARSIPLALGTDSLASNSDLDMAREARLLMKYFPDITGAMAFDIATRGGAEALSMPDGSGTLRAGSWFDAVAVKIDSGKPVDPIKAIMNPKRIIDRVWVDGTITYRNREKC